MRVLAMATFSQALMSKLALFSVCVWTVMGNGSLCPSGEQHRSKMDSSRGLVQAAGRAGTVLASQLEPRAVFRLLPLHCNQE